MPVVVDASALVWAVTSTGEAPRRLRQQLAGDTCHAPHLVDAELGNALRRKVLRGEFEPDVGFRIVRRGATLVDHRYEHHGVLAARAWTLRDNVTFYDACYAALAAHLNVLLVTADVRLAVAPNLPCEVEVVG